MEDDELERRIGSEICEEIIQCPLQEALRCEAERRRIETEAELTQILVQTEANPSGGEVIGGGRHSFR
ncbi:hypothetical protein QYF36_005757 [Acer negundo]|nr:hypothetical protein QYF36_005757 [Acer negundo]